MVMAADAPTTLATGLGMLLVLVVSPFVGCFAIRDKTNVHSVYLSSEFVTHFHYFCVTLTIKSSSYSSIHLRRHLRAF